MNGSGILEAAILDYYVFTGEHSRKKKGFVLMITYRYYSLVFGQKQLRIFQLHYFTSPLDAVKIQHTFFYHCLYKYSFQCEQWICFVQLTGSTSSN